MSTFTEFINQSWVASLGWALLHTLWQGAFIAIITVITLRFIPISKSNIRYAISLGAIGFICMLFIGTLCYLEFGQSANSSLAIQANHEMVTLIQVTAVQGIILSPLEAVVSFVNTYLNIIILVWLAGVSLLFIRLAGSFWYLEKIRSNSTLLSGTVLEQLNLLAYQMHIPQWIDLAENPSIHSPLVIGVFKPIILVPVGMLTGLSSEQIESIFIHELTHIKRHDYLVNLLQSIVEVILFFNPFVMLLSNLLRRERENCCDDVVLDRLNNPLLYVKTLAQLEEYKYVNNQLAISFAGNKNYLLNRIKRIMEHTAQKQNGKGRFLSIILLVVGLISASWLSMSPASREEQKTKNSPAQHVSTPVNPADTIPEVRVVPTFPTPLEPIVEDIEIEPIEPIETIEPIQLALAIPPVEMNMVPLEPIDVNVKSDVNLLPIDVHLTDTIPPYRWEDFNIDFQENYKLNLEALNESMRELELTLSQLKNEERITKEVEEKLRIAEKIQREKLKELEHIYQTDVMERQQEAMRKAQAAMEVYQSEQNEKMKGLGAKITAFGKAMLAYEKALKEELVKDGYLEKGNELSTINWNHGVLEINGKALKEKDQKKYKAIQKKYLEDGDVKVKWE